MAYPPDPIDIRGHHLERADDIARVESGEITAAELGRENGAFGIAVAQAGVIDWAHAASIKV